MNSLTDEAHELRERYFEAIEKHRMAVNALLDEAARKDFTPEGEVRFAVAMKAATYAREQSWSAERAMMKAGIA